ncbi:hypothetical protein PR002_g17164 [Phytophthora rubi]|uniref:Uncharacterized protein n=1 Tax=Phytophthora rubi TaxID=129364 RepID=A0A6A3KC13_9STRA|nr:hypothetical protein PR002_g17164 [Phytophthora rubi]
MIEMNIELLLVIHGLVGSLYSRSSCPTLAYRVSARRPISKTNCTTPSTTST